MKSGQPLVPGTYVAAATPITAGRLFQSRLDWLTQIGAILVALMGTLVLGGWFLHMPVLTHVLPGLTSMKVNTAVGVLAAGLALLWLHMCAAASVRFRLARVLAVALAVLGGLTLAEDLLGLQLGIDRSYSPMSSTRRIRRMLARCHPRRRSIFYSSALLYKRFGLGDLILPRSPIGWL
jgi:hypothetical protein